MGLFNKFKKDETPRNISFQASLRGNLAIPGQTGVEGEPDYLAQVETEAMAEIRRRNINQRAGQEIMMLIGRVQHLQRGHERALEQLAEDIIKEEYASILNGVELDIQLVGPGEPNEQLEYDQEQEQGEPPKFENVTDVEIKMEIDKRKIANNISQGEAKNTHRLIHKPEVREAIDAIHPDLFELYDRILKISEYFDWMLPMEQQVQMIQHHPEGMGGSVKVDWQPKEYKAEKEKDIEQILKGDEEMEGEGEPMDMVPTIHAKGIDFPMLIHETVKGVFELIAANGIPEDQELAQVVIMNADTLSSEIEDLRYGPHIAADLRDFILANPNSDTFPNIREFVWGKIVSMPAEDFLNLIREILMGTGEARTFVDKLINDTIKELREYEVERLDDSLGTPLYDVDKDYGLEDEEEKEDNIPLHAQEREVGNNYGEMSQIKLQELLDAALDAGDFIEVERISKYLHD